MPITARRSVLLTLAASPHPEAAAYLLEVVSAQPFEAAEAALIALGASRFREEQRERVRALVEARRSGELTRAFEQAFAPR